MPSCVTMSQSHRKIFSTLYNWILCCGHDQPKQGLRPVKLISSRASCQAEGLDQAGSEDDWDRVAEPSGRAGRRLSFAWGPFRWTKVPPGLHSLRKGNLPGRDLLSDGFWPSHTAMLKSGSPIQARHVGHCWQNTTFTRSTAHPARAPPHPRGGWAVCGHLEEEKMQVPAVYPRVSCAPSCVLLQQGWWYLHSLKPQLLEPWAFQKLRGYVRWEKAWKFV